MAYGYLKDLPKRTASNKVLHDKELYNTQLYSTHAPLKDRKDKTNTKALGRLG